MTVYREYGGRASELSLNEVSKLYKLTFLDDSFQRRGGVEHGSGWSVMACQLYIGNLISGKTGNTILVADVKKCLRHAQELGKCALSLEYFKGIVNEGKYKYVSIDGNNTASSIAHFLEGKIKACFKTENGLKFKSFSDFSPEMQEQIRHSLRVRLVCLEEIGLMQMTELFRNENTSTALNKQERRQARLTPLAKAIRDLSSTEEVRAMFQELRGFTAAKLDQRDHEQFVAAFCLRRMSNLKKNTRSKELDQMYEDNDALEPHVLISVEHVLSTLSKINQEVQRSAGKKPVSKLSNGRMCNLAEFVYLIKDCGLEINDGKGKQFLDFYLHCCNLLDKKCAPVEGTVPEDATSFKHWEGRTSDSAMSIKTQAVLRGILMENASNLINKKVLGKIPLTGQESRIRFEVKKEEWLKLEPKDRWAGSDVIRDLYSGLLPETKERKPSKAIKSFPLRKENESFQPTHNLT